MPVGRIEVSILPTGAGYNMGERFATGRSYSSRGRKGAFIEQVFRRVDFGFFVAEVAGPPRDFRKFGRGLLVQTVQGLYRRYCQITLIGACDGVRREIGTLRKQGEESI